jgi:hypothetical protein
VSAESEGDVLAELGMNCNLGKTIASVCLACRCPHHPITQVMPRWLVFNVALVVDAPMMGEEGYPPGFGPVDLTAD